ncbi:MAG: MBL fold metallo-hydrolase [Zoogloeaceae bacterium]|jgi:glyoxylase-like metal-dependent hydrolase (beta-lactamase superfamily II)|nr:MBL fold metallo-hydrolase [Zoogloeaceae bacterium]
MRYAILPVTHFAQNCTVLWCEDTRAAAVIDPGGDIPLVLDFLTQEKLVPADILATHGHIDHVGGVLELAGHFPEAAIAGPHEGDRFNLEALPRQCRAFGFPETAAFAPGRWLVEGDQIHFGAETLEVLHCPGHTPGHVVFYHRESPLLIVGDVLFHGSIGRVDFPGGDLATLLASIQEKLLPLGDDIAFIPGHGPMSTLGEERRSNPYLSCGQLPRKIIY